MRSQTHDNNKYANVGLIRHNVSSFTKDKTYSPIRLDLSHAREAVFDLGFMSHRPKLQQCFYSVVDLLKGSVSALTMITSYLRAIKNLSVFLDEYDENSDIKILETNQIDKSLMINFRLYLELRPKLTTNIIGKTGSPNEDGERLDLSTAHNIYGIISYLLKKAISMKPENFPKLTGAFPRWRKQNPHTKLNAEVLSVDDLKKILALAKDDYVRIKTDYEKIKESLKRTENYPINGVKTHGYWGNFDNYVHSVIRENGIDAVSTDKLNSIARHYKYPSPPTIVSMYIPVMTDALLPMAIILHISTAINVAPLTNLRRDCVQDFPIKNFKSLIYDKPRSGNKRHKAHLISAKKNISKEIVSPLEIVEFLLEWTTPLLEMAEDQLRPFLFLYRPSYLSRRGWTIKKVDPHNAYDAALKNFFERHKDKIKKFTLSELRPAIASLIYAQTKDIFRVKRFLGHAHIITTVKYIKGNVVNAIHDKKISQGIDRMFQIISTENARADPSAEKPAILAEFVINDETEPNVAVETISSEELKRRKYGSMTLTSRCRDPLSPPSSFNVAKGRVCSEIYKCLSCPNAAVLKEDFHIVLDRIDRIWKERETMSEDAWQAIHAEGWLALNAVVLEMKRKLPKEEFEKLVGNTRKQ